MIDFNVTFIFDTKITHREVPPIMDVTLYDDAEKYENYREFIPIWSGQCRMISEFRGFFRVPAGHLSFSGIAFFENDELISEFLQFSTIYLTIGDSMNLSFKIEESIG